MNREKLGEEVTHDNRGANMELKDKALLVIEAITSDVTMMDLELHPLEDKIIRTLMAKLSAIYRYAHIARNPSCIDAHDDWVEGLKKTYKFLRKVGEV